MYKTVQHKKGYSDDKHVERGILMPVPTIPTHGYNFITQKLITHNILGKTVCNTNDCKIRNCTPERHAGHS